MQLVIPVRPHHFVREKTHDSENITGGLELPEKVSDEGSAAVPLVVFVHGSGSSRFSPRNRMVAATLRERAHVCTLLMDLLTPSEAEFDEMTRAIRFDIGFLASRVEEVCQAVCGRDDAVEGVRFGGVGLFGASTGGAAALMASRKVGASAVVSRGGRPDLVPSEELEQVESAVKLIVGSRDTEVIAMNQEAYGMLKRARQKSFDIVPGATHLFEEAGTLEQVAAHAASFFAEHLSS